MTRISRSTHGPLVLVLLFAVAASCTDSTAPAGQQKTTDDLHFIRFAPNAPQIRDTVLSFYAKLGENREIRLRYAAAPGAESEDFLRFEVPDNALDRRPDGTPFALGDSIRITVRLTSLTAMVFDFQPSGLRFRADHPARLRVEFAHADGDVNGDGVHDATDVQLLATAGIWKQETPGDPWVRLSDILHLELDEVEADIVGFTGYAFAY